LRASSVAYLDEKPYRAGEPVPIGRRLAPAEEELYLGFIDHEPGRNWGHRCLYVRHGAGGTRTDEGTLPPRIEGTGRRLTVLWVGADVPEWAVVS
jgi:hypothetical protein